MPEQINREISRVEFLRGNWRGRGSPVRPPWSLDEEHFLKACDGCSACIDSCPEQILIRGRGRYPQVDFTRGECTFCQRCVEVCKPAALVIDADLPPWRLKAEIAANCLAMQAVVCRACGEVCDEQAIQFRLALGGVSRPELDRDACNGCGACIKPCPVQAIAINQSDSAGQAAGQKESVAL
ncbi:MAG: ferredoxin-type protein NapF [Pseudomonadota bacterium]